MLQRSPLSSSLYTVTLNLQKDNSQSLKLHSEKMETHFKWHQYAPESYWSGPWRGHFSWAARAVGGDRAEKWGSVYLVSPQPMTVVDTDGPATNALSQGIPASPLPALLSHLWPAWTVTHHTQLHYEARLGRRELSAMRDHAPLLKYFSGHQIMQKMV